MFQESTEILINCFNDLEIEFEKYSLVLNQGIFRNWIKYAIITNVIFETYYSNRKN